LQRQTVERGAGKKSISPLLCVIPIVDFISRLAFCVAVPLLNFPFKLIKTPGNDVYAVISELPHCSCFSLICFQLPSTWFQSISIFSCIGYGREFNFRLFAENRNDIGQSKLTIRY